MWEDILNISRMDSLLIRATGDNFLVLPFGPFLPFFLSS